MPNTIEVLDDILGIPVGTILSLTEDGSQYVSSTKDEVIADNYEVTTSDYYSVSVDTVKEDMFKSVGGTFRSLDPVEVTKDKYEIVLTCLACGTPQVLGEMEEANGVNITIVEGKPLVLSCESCGNELALEVIKK